MKTRFILIGILLGALFGGVAGLVAVLPATYSLVHTLSWQTIAALLQATFFDVAYVTSVSGAVIGGITGYRHWWYEQQK